MLYLKHLIWKIMKSKLEFFKIYKKMFLSNLMQQMEYKADFIMRSTFELAIVLSNYILYVILYSNVDIIGGWTKEQAIMLTMVSALLDCIITLFFVGGLFKLPEMINTGSLDFLLLKPINKRAYISFSELTVSQVPNFFIELGILMYCIISSKEYVSVESVLLFVLLMINSILILYSILFAIMCISFWTIKFDIGLNMFFQLYYIGNKPMNVYPVLVQKIFTFIIPLGVAFNVPVLAVFKSIKMEKVLMSFVIAVIFFAISDIIFKKGLKKYVSASS